MALEGIPRTRNHNFNIPEEGYEDWDDPLNDNFKDIDERIPIRDLDTNKSEYAALHNAKFEATDTGQMYYGDGSTWVEYGTISTTHEGDSLSPSSVAVDSALTINEGATTSAPSPVDTDDIATKGYVDQTAQGLEYRDAVIAEQNAPPASPSSGDRYLVLTSPSGDWSGHANEIAVYDGSTWTFNIPSNNWAIYVEGSGLLKTFQDGEWKKFGGTASHDNLTDVSPDDHHTRYTNAEAISAVNNDGDHATTASHNYFSGSHNDLSDIGASDHHSRYTDSEAVSAVNNDANHSSVASHSHDHLSGIGSDDHHTRYTNAEAVTAVESGDTSIEETLTVGGYLNAESNIYLNPSGRIIPTINSTSTDADNQKFEFNVIDDSGQSPTVDWLRNGNLGIAFRVYENGDHNGLFRVDDGGEVTVEQGPLTLGGNLDGGGNNLTNINRIQGSSMAFSAETAAIDLLNGEDLVLWDSQNSLGVAQFSSGGEADFVTGPLKESGNRVATRDWVSNGGYSVGGTVNFGNLNLKDEGVYYGPQAQSGGSKIAISSTQPTLSDGDVWIEV